MILHESSPIEIVAPAPRRFTSAEQALAYYKIMGVQTREDIIILAEFVREELQKIHSIMDDVLGRIESGE